MVLELGDEALITNDKTDYSCRVEFKTKGFVFGDYNDIAGKVKHGSSSIAEIGGKWSDRMDIKKKVSSHVYVVWFRLPDRQLTRSLPERAERQQQTDIL